MSAASAWGLFLASGAAAAYLAWHRLLAYLRYFQQEGYEPLRFLRWTGPRSLTDPAFWLSIVCVWTFPREPVLVTLVFLAGAIALVRVQPDPQRSGKITLKMTWRATRIHAAALALAAAFWIGLAAAYSGVAPAAAFIASSATFAALPLMLIAGNWCLTPYERSTQRWFEADAARRLAQVGPFTIGITGSFGKSSSKAMLAHILRLHAPTLAASGSVNTLMGLARHIREELVPGHVFMVVEMGAFRTGSIARLCRFAPPSAALITAVGDMHLERFGSLEAIVQAKSELAAALPPGGLLVANADSPGALQIARRASACRVLLYGESSQEELETRLEDVSFSRHGTRFRLRTRDRVLPCQTPLLGRPIVLNLTGVFTMARALGVDPAVIVAGMATLRPVANRLEVMDESGVTWIRDAYNSNQAGFRAALEVAAALPAARRFLVTPGVIELGSEQFTVNRALSQEAAAVCDATVVVSPTNRDAFVAGHGQAGQQGRLVALESRSDAFTWLRKTVKEGDLVILENDLPDLYEPAGVFWGR